jgi:hypothetical protein
MRKRRGPVYYLPGKAVWMRERRGKDSYLVRGFTKYP